MNHCTAWCIGEFGSKLLMPCPESVGGAHINATVTELEIYELLSKMMRRHSSTDQTKAYVVNASFKLTSRMKDPLIIEKFTKILKKYSSNVHLELQARSCEYLNLLKPNFVTDNVRAETLKPMPLPDIQELRKKRSRLKSMKMNGDSDSGSGSDSDSDSDEESGNKSGSSSGIRMPVGNGSSNGSSSSGGNDLLDVFGTGSPIKTNVGSNNSGSNSGGGDLLDLGDIFGGGGSGNNGNNGGNMNVAPSAPASNGGGMDDLLGMFGDSSSSSTPAATATPTPDFPSITAYDKNGILITMNCYNTGSAGVTRIVSTTVNNSGGSVSNYAFQAAVLAKMSVELSPPSGTTISPGSSVTQEMTLTNTLVGTVSCFFYFLFFLT